MDLFVPLNNYLSRIAPLDKCYHLIGGIVLFSLGNFYSATFGLCLVIAMGIGKELYDYLNRENHTPDLWDAVATIAGGMLGYICTVPTKLF